MAVCNFCVCAREKRETKTDPQRDRYRERDRDRHTQRLREGHVIAGARTHSAQVEIRDDLEGICSYHLLSCVETEFLLLLLLWTSGSWPHTCVHDPRLHLLADIWTMVFQMCIATSRSLHRAWGAELRSPGLSEKCFCLNHFPALQHCVFDYHLSIPPSSNSMKFLHFYSISFSFVRLAPT